MAGSKRGKAGSASRRRQGRRPTGEAATFSLGLCTSNHHTAAASDEEGSFSLRPCATKHMAVEEALAGEDGTFSLRPCATKHMAVEEVPGEEGPLIGCPSKRKAGGSGCSAAAGVFPKAGECEALEMFPALERSSATEDPNLLEPMAVEQQQMMSEAMLREEIKADLLNFPEAAALDTDQLGVAADKIIKQSRPETASPTAPGMRRLSDSDINAFFSLEAEIPTVDDLAPGGVFPPGWIEERRLQLDKEVQPEKKKLGDDIGVLLAKIRVDLLTKGFVEVPELYLQDTPDLRAAQLEAAAALNPPDKKKEYTGFAGPDDEEWWMDEAILNKMALESY